MIEIAIEIAIEIDENHIKASLSLYMYKHTDKPCTAANRINRTN
jgi:hypothetical protein